MIDIKISSDLDKLVNKLETLEPKRWPTKLTRAINETAFYVVNKLKKEMPGFIDRPTPFTLNALRVTQKASVTNNDLVDATVGFKEFGSKANWASHYLVPQVDGGDRALKRFEKALVLTGVMNAGYFVLPAAAAPRDQYGNVPGKFIVRVLSQLRADLSGTQNTPQPTTVAGKGNRAAAARYRQKKRLTKPTYYAVQNGIIYPGGGHTTLAPGIYERHPREKSLKQVFFFARDVHFRKRFPFYEIAAKAAQDKMPQKIQDEIDNSSKS